MTTINIAFTLLSFKHGDQWLIDLRTDGVVELHVDIYTLVTVNKLIWSVCGRYAGRYAVGKPDHLVHCYPILYIRFCRKNNSATRSKSLVCNNSLICKGYRRPFHKNLRKCSDYRHHRNAFRLCGHLDFETAIFKVQRNWVGFSFHCTI